MLKLSPELWFLVTQSGINAASLMVAPVGGSFSSRMFGSWPNETMGCLRHPSRAEAPSHNSLDLDET
ncbi:hypothetical protein, partial [Vreelandella neptunia]|uniref:hypothetical protein n=1 Tax=Vreelandella neptunia TaxID=115551 RepID=UPI001CB9ECEA